MDSCVADSSGDVPRELTPGVVWDRHAEKRFVQAVSEWRRGRIPLTDEDAEREARWGIEASLYRRFWCRVMSEAKACRTDQEKREAYRRWVEKFGKQRADEIAAKARDHKFVEVACGWRD